MSWQAEGLQNECRHCRRTYEPKPGSDERCPHCGHAVWRGYTSEDRDRMPPAMRAKLDRGESLTPDDFF